MAMSTEEYNKYIGDLYSRGDIDESKYKTFYAEKNGEDAAALPDLYARNSDGSYVSAPVYDGNTGELSGYVGGTVGGELGGSTTTTAVGSTIYAAPEPQVALAPVSKPTAETTSSKPIHDPLDPVATPKGDTTTTPTPVAQPTVGDSSPTTTSSGYVSGMTQPTADTPYADRIKFLENSLLWWQNEGKDKENSAEVIADYTSKIAGYQGFIDGGNSGPTGGTNPDGTVLTEAEVSLIPMEGTLPGSPIQIDSPDGITASTTSATNIDQVIAGTEQAQTPEEIEASLIDSVALVDSIDPTQVAQGTLSDGSIASVDFEPSEGTQAIAQEVGEIPEGAMVEAAIGEMSPESLAQAAQVAGVEVARITRAKEQLANAGLTPEEIAEFANDPTALETRLLDFTEEQRGIIGGLPEEALVSTQMEALLAGMENGETPLWAKPAVAAVENMLARRGLTASTVGRDALFNAIIQSALPLAQQNAQSIKESVLQQKGFEQQTALANAQLRQQATLQNAQNSFNLDLTNLNNEQQANVANAQFMQTVTLTDANNRQQTAIQNAVNMTQLDMANLDSMTKLAVSNAQSFLQMDLTNLSNRQQGIIIDQQFEQQRMFTNAAAENTAKQFNASSENQVAQFMASLKANVDQFNVQQSNAMGQFNATESNKISAQNAGNQILVEQFNAQLATQVDQFNAQQDLAVEQWNAANAQAIQQSNVAWRRQANTINTAAQNAINQQNVQNSFALSMAELSNMWQEMRDQANFDFQAYENDESRKAQLYATAIGNESAATAGYDQSEALVDLAKSFFDL